MKKSIVAIFALLVLVSTTNFCLSAETVSAGPSDYLLITGTVNNPQGKGRQGGHCIRLRQRQGDASP